MSLLTEYEQRTAWKYEPIRGSFYTADGLANKVGQDGSFVPFPGSTVVFRPEKLCVQVVELMQRLLYHKLDGTDMLAAPLPAAAIHMTLHDLISRETCGSDPADEKQYGREVSESLARAAEIVERIRSKYAGRRIAMTADRIVNMVSKSLVLMLRPQTEEDYALLMELYRPFDAVRSLPYPLTPHITLAYFKPGKIDGDKLGRAVEFAQINPANAPVFTFWPEGLTAQGFLDMQSYIDIPKRICFCCDGGLNRSVMAANILNHLAKERKLPVTGEARSAFQNTQGRPVPEQVWAVLDNHGIPGDRGNAVARYLEEKEAAWFTAFAGISQGAMESFSRLGIPEEKIWGVSRFFFGVKDPEYGGITHEQAYRDLRERMENYLAFLMKES